MTQGIRGSQPPCSVDGCERASLARGWCSPHYQRWEQHGDPLGGRRPNGESLRWLKALIVEATDSADDTCRTAWPYFRTEQGYPLMWWRGRMRYAHLAVLDLTGRPKPTPKSLTRHLCGNGHLGCLHPRHLKWGTAVENMADKLEHGTSNRGEQHPLAKLTAEDVRAIRASDEPRKVLALRYGISSSALSDILRRKNWAHLPD